MEACFHAEGKVDEAMEALKIDTRGADSNCEASINVGEVIPSMPMDLDDILEKSLVTYEGVIGWRVNIGCTFGSGDEQIEFTIFGDNGREQVEIRA
ncbi:hypothetical protein TKK_0000278 [Trichogramma kaykai]